MTVPQSLLVVALAVAWIVVLVPSSSRRRGHVKESVEGSGFRVLRRAPTVGRRLNRQASPVGAPPRRAAQDHRSSVDSEDQMSSQQGNDDFRDDDTLVAEHDEDARPLAGITREESAEREDAESAAGDALTEDDEMSREEAAAYDEHDEAELRRQYQAWRAGTRDRSEATGAAPADATSAEEAEPADVRPIPRRPGRGVYDPEAAERARAYRFARRRRAVLVLTLLIVGFALAAVLVSSTLWIGAGVSAVLLALFLTYLRRQVRIEADIRARRLAKLQRARQIRPEHVPDADDADPYATRPARSAGSVQAAGPGRRRSNRVVLELDDDDPGFDDLEQYEPMEYRRAVGQ